VGGVCLEWAGERVMKKETEEEDEMGGEGAGQRERGQRFGYEDEEVGHYEQVQRRRGRGFGAKVKVEDEEYE
jgi:hypothetical protein